MQESVVHDEDFCDRTQGINRIAVRNRTRKDTCAVVLPFCRARVISTEVRAQLNTHNLKGILPRFVDAT